jgi:hypothetical protein
MANSALMNIGKRYAFVVFCCAAALAFTGCASPNVAGGGEPSQGSSTLPAIARDASSIANVAGKYQGKFFLKKKAIGDISFDLSQSGTTVGGTLKLVLSKTTREPVALTLDAASNTLTGTAVDPSGKTACAYTISASYNPKTFVLSGTSSPLTCPGKVANFKTTESCFYNTTPSMDARRPAARGILEC